MAKKSDKIETLRNRVEKGWNMYIKAIEKLAEIDETEADKMRDKLDAQGGF